MSKEDHHTENMASCSLEHEEEGGGERDEWKQWIWPPVFIPKP